MEAQLQKLISVVSTMIALQVVTLAAVIGVSWYSHEELKQYVSEGAAGQRSALEPVENWGHFVREHNATQGNDDAAVVVVEFSDFQCPFCRQYSDETRRAVIAKYGDKVRMVFKHYPLQQIHPQAMTAAIAAQCALREGKFWEVHERFFSQPHALSIASVIEVGESLGLSAAYAACVMNEETKTEVEQDMRDGMEVGVQGTPTLMVNGEFLVGAVPEANLLPIFERAGILID